MEIDKWKFIYIYIIYTYIRDVLLNFLTEIPRLNQFSIQNQAILIRRSDVILIYTDNLCKTMVSPQVSKCTRFSFAPNNFHDINYSPGKIPCFFILLSLTIILTHLSFRAACLRAENQGVNTRAGKQFQTSKQAYFPLRNYIIIAASGGGYIQIKSNIGSINKLSIQQSIQNGNKWSWLDAYDDTDMIGTLWGAAEPQAENSCAEYNTESHVLTTLACNTPRGYMCRYQWLK